MYQDKAATILLVDDEEKILEVVKSYLEKDGYEVQTAASGQKAIDLFEQIHPALVILDLMLPDISGEEICSRLRQKSRVPIIMLTAKVQEDSIIEGLNRGADDYVTKPFSARQLMARIAALLRRSGEDAAPLANTMQFSDGDLAIDFETHQVHKAGQAVNLTPNEFKLLCSLLKYPKKVFTREELIEQSLGHDFEGYDRVIDTHVKNLRQKIETDPRRPVYIITVHGIGYKFGGE